MAQTPRDAERKKQSHGLTKNMKPTETPANNGKRQQPLAPATCYAARKNEIIEKPSGRQVAVVLASGCSRKQAGMMAAFAAQQMNHEMRRNQHNIKAEPPPVSGGEAQGKLSNEN